MKEFELFTIIEEFFQDLVETIDCDTCPIRKYCDSLPTQVNCMNVVLASYMKTMEYTTLTDEPEVIDLKNNVIKLQYDNTILKHQVKTLEKNIEILRSK